VRELLKGQTDDLKNEQWTLAEELVKIMEPFEEATTFLSYEENSSLSSVLPVLFGLIDGLKQTSENEDESFPAILNDFKIKIADKITKRWELENLDTSTPLVLSPLIDPRFKLLESPSETDKQLIKTEVLKPMNDFSGIASSSFDSDCVEVTVLTERRTGQSEEEPVRTKVQDHCFRQTIRSRKGRNISD